MVKSGVDRRTTRVLRKLVVIGIVATFAAGASVGVVARAEPASQGKKKPPAPRVLVATPLTIRSVLHRLRAGDTLELESGTYTKAIEINVSAVIVRAARGAQPLLANRLDIGSDVAVTGVVVRGLTVSNPDHIGVAVWNGSQVVFRDSTFSGNGTANTSNAGSGLYIDNGTVVGRRLKIDGNGRDSQFHHGVYISSGSLRLVDSEVMGNAGWGIQIYPGGSTVELVRTKVSGNGRSAVEIGWGYGVRHLYVEASDLSGNNEFAIAARPLTTGSTIVVTADSNLSNPGGASDDEPALQVVPAVPAPDG